MVAGGFGPYHRLWRGGTQTKRTGAIHTGRRRLRLVWAQSTGGASGEYPPPQCNYVFFFNACTLLIISLNISIYLTLY
jgi:hypothetical protein